jgi:cytosine/adenosine deaminase-related metal-dependent hydrolase
VPQLVLVHGNYPEGEDLQWIRQTRPTVCWCPRSHAFFGHDPWPLADYVETGANLTLGTDSLASNDGLDMWGEITAAAQAHPDASRTGLLRMATVNGRRALSVPDDAADIAIWSLPEGAGDESLERLLNRWVTRHPALIASFSQGQLTARAV